MTHDEKLVAVKKFFDQCLEIQDKKGKDYMVESDVWKDIREEAVELGVSPYKLIFIFMHKHYKAIRRFANYGKVESEPIEGRLADLINFTSMLYAYIQSEKEGKSNG